MDRDSDSFIDAAIAREKILRDRMEEEKKNDAGIMEEA